MKQILINYQICNCRKLKIIKIFEIVFNFNFKIIIEKLLLSSTKASNLSTSNLKYQTNAKIKKKKFSPFFMSSRVKKSKVKFTRIISSRKLKQRLISSLIDISNPLTGSIKSV